MTLEELELYYGFIGDVDTSQSWEYALVANDSTRCQCDKCYDAYLLHMAEEMENVA